jgi:hypothetical protein
MFCITVGLNCNFAELILMRFVVKEFHAKTFKLKVTLIWENVVKYFIRRRDSLLFIWIENDCFLLTCL